MKIKDTVDKTHHNIYNSTTLLYSNTGPFLGDSMLLTMVIATVVLYTASAIRYIYLTWTKKIEPVPTTWVLMLTMFMLSVWMYWKYRDHSLAGNIGNIAGLLNVAAIFVGVLATNLRDGTWKIGFNSFQKYCLAGGVLIVVFWFITNEVFWAYILTQVLALVAYSATVKKLWNAERTTEDIYLWVCVLIACLTSIYPAVVKHDMLGWVYLGRAIPSTSLMIYMILRLRLKNPPTTPNAVAAQEGTKHAPAQ